MRGKLCRGGCALSCWNGTLAPGGAPFPRALPTPPRSRPRPRRAKALSLTYSLPPRAHTKAGPWREALTGRDGLSSCWPAAVARSHSALTRRDRWSTRRLDALARPTGRPLRPTVRSLAARARRLRRRTNTLTYRKLRGRVPGLCSTRIRTRGPASTLNGPQCICTSPSQQ